MIPKQGIDFEYIQRAFQRRFWYVVLPSFLVSLIIVLYCIFAPRGYKAQTVILVEPQRVPGDYVSSTVTIDLQSRLRTITQQLKSRTRLEKIIQDYDLYPDIRKSATMTDAVEIFSENIEVNVRGGRQAFEVSFQGPDPVKVRDVTNTIANQFIEDNLKLREAQAAGTTMFLDRELEKLEQGLQEMETAIRKFKEQYRGYLPENMNQNNLMMSHLQKQLDSINTTIQQTKDRRILLETQLSNLRRMEAQFDSFAGADMGLDDTDSPGAGPGARLDSPDLAELRGRLKSLKTRYSDKHPDVIKAQAAIAKLEEELAEIDPEDDNAGIETDTGGDDTSLFSAQIEDLSAQVDMADIEMRGLLQDQNKLQRELSVYLDRIESGPKIEQMLADLRRGYDETDSNYRSLLDKKFKAKLSENLEVAQQGEQFTILDHARLPDKPSKPQTRKLLLLGFCVALAGGFGLALLVEYLDPSFFNTKELENALDFPVLVSIPVIMTDQDLKRAFVKRVVSAVALVSMACVLLCALYFLWRMDPMAMSLTAS